MLSCCRIICGQQAGEIPSPVMGPIRRWQITPETKKIYLNRYSTGNFSCGLVAVCNEDKDSRWGFVDTAGNLVIDYKYGNMFTDVPRFSEGLCAFELPDGTGSILLDTKGNTVLTLPGFYDLSDFRDGVASACQIVKKGTFSAERRVVYINKKGQIVFPNLTQKLEPGLLFDKNNTRPVSEGMMAVFNYSKRLWGYADAKGNPVIAAKYRNAENFSEGLALVQMDESPGLWGYIDKTGQPVIEPKFSVKPLSFSHGYAVAAKRDKTLCLIDKTGAVAYDGCVSITSFYKGYAMICVEPAGQYKRPLEYYLIDTNFRRVKKLPEIPLSIIGEPMEIEYVDGLAVYGSGDTGDIYDYLGNLIIPGNNTGNFYDGLAKSGTEFKNDKTGGFDWIGGFVNKKGEFVFIFLKPEF